MKYLALYLTRYNILVRSIVYVVNLKKSIGESEKKSVLFSFEKEKKSQKKNVVRTVKTQYLYKQWYSYIAHCTSDIVSYKTTPALHRPKRVWATETRRDYLYSSLNLNK